MSQEGSTIQLVLTREQVQAFSPFFQQGFGFPIHSGCTLEDLLCRQIGLDSEFVTGRITTIFLDYKPVDDIKSTVLRSGSTLALSGAMPGLVGATMRRGGFYAAMRGGISHAEDENSALCGEGEIKIKLFNLMLSDLGPVFLLKGIVLTQLEVMEFLRLQEHGFWGGCSGTVLDGRPILPEVLKRGELNLRAGDRIRLCVVFEEPES